jgi:hypothetical protein
VSGASVVGILAWGLEYNGEVRAGRGHTTDLLALRGEFEGFERDDADRMLRKAVSIINRRTEAAAIVLCEREEFEALAPKAKGQPRDPYALCCHICMFMLGKWMKSTNRQGRIAYFFESGNQHAGEAHRLLSLAVTPEGKAVGLADRYRYESHTFLNRAVAPPLQAADLLAWEWTKLYDETIKRPIRPAS